MALETEPSTPRNNPPGRAPVAANLLLGVVLAVLSIGGYFVLFAPLFFAWQLLVRRARWQEAVRIYNVMFGEFALLLARPFVRVRRKHFERIPRGRACVIVCNHRSYIDVFLTSQLGIRNANIAIRSWPFRLPVLGWFMRAAGYMEMGADAIDKVLAHTGEQARRGVSFLFFPEGHRSRDGRLQRFRSGAFLVADAHDLPVLCVCITGSERIAPPGTGMMLRPGEATLDVLGLVEPRSVEGPKRALRLRRLVEDLFRSRLDEPLNGEAREDDDEPMA